MRLRQRLKSDLNSARGKFKRRLAKSKHGGSLKMKAFNYRTQPPKALLKKKGSRY